MDGRTRMFGEPAVPASCEAERATRLTVARREPCFQPSSQRYVLLGICGSGMRALCEMLLDAGHEVLATDSQLGTPSEAAAEKSGWPQSRIRILTWDAALSSVRAPGDAVGQAGRIFDDTASLQNLVSGGCGADKDPSFGSPVDAVVASNAVPEQDLRVTTARQAGVPVFRLTHALSQMLAEYHQLCVAGTHGKTTTTAMLWHMLSMGHGANAAFVGGQLAGSRRSGFLNPASAVYSGTLPSGGSGWAVVESCEYRNAFSSLRPEGIVLTGIERDHFDCFPDAESEDQVFLQFAGKLASTGFLVVNADCARARKVAAQMSERVGTRITTFSLDQGPDWTADQFHVENRGTRFRVSWQGRPEGWVQLQVPGLHNVRNALAGIAAATELGLSFSAAAARLSEFRGVCRRFEDRGQWRGMQFIDDYAHHPTAIRATLSTARQNFPNRRIIAVFEPHQISRVEQLFEEFSDALRAADEILVLPVLAARETSTRTLCCRTSGRLVRSINLAGGRAFLLADLDQVVGRIDHAGRPGDVLITMGAGRTNQIHDEFNRRLQRDFVA